MSFAADKSYGEAATVALARWFSTMGLPVEFATGNFPPWDLWVCGCLEIKRDRLAETSGNFFVETSAHDKPSGIMRTKARAWVFVAGNTAYLVGCEKLRAILDTLQPRHARDGKQGRLLPLAKLRALPHLAVNLSEFLE
jgi:hypothetical protein